jgi:transposase-like protein
MEKFTIKDFNAKYTSDDVCFQEIFTNRYGSLKKCPSCKEETKFHKVTDRKCYACQWCGYQLHPLAGTIFHKSETSLKSWFYAIFLFANSKNGVSGKELQRQLGVTYKTAWRMAKQIRLLFSKAKPRLSKNVEIDETYFGGVKHGMHGRCAAAKTPIMGMVERKGSIVARIIKRANWLTMTPIIRQYVEVGTRIFTDENRSYNWLGVYGYKHDTVMHKKEYVHGDIYTNTIEGFWSQLKRSVHGTYHSVSPKYLQNYVDEFAYRYNHRFDASPLFYPMISQAGRPV